MIALKLLVLAVLSIGGLALFIRDMYRMLSAPPWMREVGKSGNVIKLEKAAQSGHSPKVGGYREQDYTGAMMTDERWNELTKGKSE